MIRIHLLGVRMPEYIPESSALHLKKSNLTPLVIRGKKILPIVQGGMGVGISAHSLAGSVAKQGGMGTIASIDLRRLHPDLMASTQYLKPSEESKAAINAITIVSFKEE